MKAATVLMEILASAGVRYLFGNPGTTELTFLDAVPDSKLEYVLGLQEATAVAAADGHAQASGNVSVANVHVAPGVANALSALQNAARAKSPVILTAGQQDSRFLMALWTAARYRLPITYVVPNNASYAILKAGMLGLGLESAKRGRFPGMDLGDPEIDYVGLARALGVRPERVEKPGDLRDVLAACIAHPGPSLVDVAIDRGFKALA